MKKSLISALLTIGLVSCTFAQARINSTFSELKEEFKYGYEMTIEETDNGTVYLTAVFEDRSVMYMFDEKMYCNISIIVPHSSGLVQAIIERYNKEYTIISPKQWRYYSEGLYSNITYEYREGLDVFVWYRGD